MEVGVQRSLKGQADGLYPQMGRADIMDMDTYCVWEVKSRKSAGLAASKAASYVGGIVCKTNAVVEGLGPSGAFENSFLLNFSGTTYIVSYHTEAAGVIIYDVKESTEYISDARVFRVYVPKKKGNISEAEQESQVPRAACGVPFIPFFIPSFGGGGNDHLIYAQR